MLAALMMALTSTALAQREIGAGVVFGTGSDDIGVSLRMRFPMPVQAVDLYLVPSIDLLEFGQNQYFLTFNAEAQADFDLSSELSLYPLAGLTFGLRDRYTPSPTEDNAQLGFNLGGGVRYQLLPRLTGVGELKASVGGFEQLLLTVGVMVDI